MITKINRKLKKMKLNKIENEKENLLKVFKFSSVVKLMLYEVYPVTPAQTRTVVYLPHAQVH